MKLSAIKLLVFSTFIFITNLSFGQAGKVPGAPETAPMRAIQISEEDQKYNDSLLNARKGTPAVVAPVGAAAATAEAETAAKLAFREKIFGNSIFSNKNLKFEPNLNIATPIDYKLGPGDVLNVELYGFSQKTFNLTVQPDGFVNIDKFGLVNVNGLTVEEAKERLKNKLSTIYIGLNSHNGYATNTYLTVSLGNIRTIRVYVIGDVVNPGTVSVNSLSSLMTALYLVGGPSEIGSYRNIQLIRKNKVVSKIDLYEFMTSGVKTGDIRLENEDRILVPPFQTRIELIGNVKKPGFFEVLTNEPLDKVIEYAGGFTEEAYTNKLRLQRNTDRERRLIDIKKAEIANFKLENGDKITVDKILDRIENQVNINGAVFRPGSYSLTENPTLLTLLKTAENVKEDAYLYKVRIIRLKPDLTQSQFSVNLSKILNGEEPDVQLQREDRVEISSNFDLKELYTIGIRGEINKVAAVAADGTQNELEKAPFYNDMTLMDLIMYAEGFKESAAGGSIDITRRKRKSGAMDDLRITSDLSETFQIKIKSNLQLEDVDAKFPLEPFDEVFVRASPNYETQQFITLTGQVIKPGPYGLQRKDERLSDLIKRCGGLSEFAFAEGATLVRENVLTELELETKRKQLDALKDTKNAALEVEAVAEVSRERIGIDLERAIKNPGSNYDIILQNGDVLNIPKKPQTVKLSGEVLYPNTTQFDDTFTFKEYISRAGGYTSQSLKGKSYILYANGSVDRTKKIFGFNKYPKVRPGSEIIVPVKTKKLGTGDVLSSIQGFSAILTTLLTTYFLIKNVKL